MKTGLENGGDGSCTAAACSTQRAGAATAAPKETCDSPLSGVDDTHTITNIKIAVGSKLCKILPAAETILMDMTTPNPRQESEAAAGDARIDWSRAWPSTVVGCERSSAHGWASPGGRGGDAGSVVGRGSEPPLNDPEKFAPWLYRLAVRQTLPTVANRDGGGKWWTITPNDSAPAIDNRQADPLGWLLAEERQTQVRTAVSRLPKRDAES